MRLNFNGIKVFYTVIFLAIVANGFFVGFKDLGISKYFFYFSVMLIVLTHVIISRIDIVFIIGCTLVFILKIIGFSELVSDSLMIVVLSWGLSYWRYEFTELHFSLILIYGLVTILVGLLQMAGVEQLHAWNTFMLSENALPKSFISTPIEQIAQSQIRPPGLFHTTTILTLFVCYFYALTLNKSMLFLPLGLLLVWISGSKIAVIFVFLYPLIMAFSKSRLCGYDYLKIYLSTIIFFLIMWMIFPEIQARRFSFDSLWASALFRLFNINEVLNIGYDFNTIKMYSDSASYFKREPGGILTGVFGFLFVFLPFVFFNFRNFLLLLAKKNPEFFSLFFVSLATPVMGDPFFMIVLHPIFKAFREIKHKESMEKLSKRQG
jgi:hypothetical protein